MLTDVSIKYMFIAGIVPGILLAVAYCIVVAYKAKKMGLNGTGVKPELKKIGKAFVKAIPALCVPLIIIVGITAGIFTATESGAVACVAAMVAGLVYRELDIKKLPQMLFRAAISTGAIFLIVAFGNIIAWSMAKDGIPGLIMTALTSLTSNKYLIILIILVLLVLIRYGFCNIGIFTSIIPTGNIHRNGWCSFWYYLLYHDFYRTDYTASWTGSFCNIKCRKN